MAKKKPTPQPYAKPDQIQIRGNEIFSPLRQKWLKATPEERVRQEFIRHLQRPLRLHIRTDGSGTEDSAWPGKPPH